MKFRRRKRGDYHGPVVFVDGAHYPADAAGHPKLKQRLLWHAERETYRWAHPKDPSHLSLYHLREVEILPSEETQA